MTESINRYDDLDAQQARISELEAQLAAAEATAAQMREALQAIKDDAYFVEDVADGNRYIVSARLIDGGATDALVFSAGETLLADIRRLRAEQEYFTSARAVINAELATLRAQAERDAAVIAAAAVWVAKLDACDPAQIAEDELIAAVRMRGDALALTAARPSAQRGGGRVNSLSGQSVSSGQRGESR